MGYLEEMSLRLESQNFPGFLQLWEEYCSNSEVIASEVIEIFEMIKDSDFHEHFGPFAEKGLDLLELLDEPEKGPAFLRLITDLQNTNSERLAKTILSYLDEKYGKEPNFREKIRLIGLRQQTNFQGAVRNFELLTHMKKGKFIYHTGGWGVGEIVEISLIREQLAIEFENVAGIKEISFKNAFHNLVPVSEDHFLARRFGDPDALEKEARENPLDILKLLLSDVGPLNAQEIKEEMLEVVIPEADWSKWWQNARVRLKKDPKIQTPSSLKDPFVFLDKEISYFDSFKDILECDIEVEDFIQKTYQFAKLHPEVLKDIELKGLYREELLKRLKGLEESQDLLKIQIYLLLEELFDEKLDQALITLVENVVDVYFLIGEFHINPLKKKMLQLIRKVRSDWANIFSEAFLNIPQHFLRDYVLKELFKNKQESGLDQALQKLLEHPFMYPDCYVWYFQKIQTDSSLPYASSEGKRLFFEGLFILLYHIESKPEWSDLVKRIHALIVKKNYQLFRDSIIDTPIEFVREILLLITKCQIFNNHDFKIFLSLSKVVHPNLDDGASIPEQQEEIIWTTQEGYHKIQERIHHIATVETVENAKEIEVARSYGDLRENSEYKFAQEKRARLQSEMKLLSSQLGKARIIAPEDISEQEVGVGTIVELVNSEGKQLEYTILGPWDADPDKLVLSFQSQLAMNMCGHKVQDTFSFKDDSYTVKAIRSYLEQV